MRFYMSIKIAVISDTHGSFKAWREAERLWRGSNLIIHLGDVLYHGPRNPLPEEYAPRELAEEINLSKIPVIIIRGNCDADIDAAILKWPVSDPYSVLWWDGRLILALHGTDLGEPGNLASTFNADLVLTGHTHVSSITCEGKTIFLNPGSASLPKGKNPASFALLDVDGIRILTLMGDIICFEPWNLI